MTPDKRSKTSTTQHAMHLRNVLLALLLGPFSVSSIRLPHPFSLSLPHNLNLPHTLGVSYEPECHRIDDPPMTGLNPSHCEMASDIICQHLGSRPPVNQWVWVEQPGCALGFWMPDFAWIVPSYWVVPSYKRIYSRIIDKCVYDSRFNAGTVNVAYLPDSSQNGTAIEGDKAMFLMAPGRLTL